jgi:predicted deacylase
MGPKGGGDTIRLGIFAGIYGDEPEGAEAIGAFFRDLEKHPSIAAGYHIYAYPICNPTGFEAHTRHDARGQDLTAHFWRGSDQPEVYYLERELGVHCFSGVISLHVCHQEMGRRLFGRAHNSLFNEALVEPALEAADQFTWSEKPDGGG